MATAGGFYNTLAEAAKLVNTQFVSGVVVEVIEEGGILDQMPVQTINSSSLTYNREQTLPVGAFHAIGDTWSSTEQAKYSQVTATLTIHGDQYDLDYFVQDTYDNPNNLRVEAMTRSAKGLKRDMEDKLIYSSVSGDANAFDGFHALIASAQVVNQGSGSTGAALSLNNLEKMIDLVRVGQKSSWIMVTSRAIGRRMWQVGRGGTTSYPILEMSVDPVNPKRKIESYDGIKITRSDYMLQTETIATSAYSAKTGGATGSVLIVSPGNVREGGCCLGMNGELFRERNIGTLEDRDAERMRVVSYLTLLAGSTKCLGMVDGITDAALAA